MQLLEQFLKNVYAERFSGEMKSNSKGDGYDLEDFREYQLGDNVKQINWKLSAKYDKEYISLYKIEKEPIIDIFVDLNPNVYFFDKEYNTYIGYLNLLFKQLGIKKNIYSYENSDLIKYNDFSEIKLNKKSQINKILLSDEFKNKKNYKIIISDFIFIEDLTELKNYPDKLFFLLFDLSKILSKSSFPIINGYFSSFVNKDLLEKYTNTISFLGKYGKLENVLG